MRSQIILSAAFIGMGLMVSCQHESKPVAMVPPAARTATPQKHWIQSDQLKATMDQIGKLHTLIPNGLPEDVESSTGREAALAAANAATLADALAQTSLLIL